MPLQIRRGGTADINLITPLVGELIYNTETGKLHVGDGATIGGIITTPFLESDAKNAAGEVFTEGTHAGITYTYDSVSRTVNSTVDLSDYDGVLKASGFNGSLFADDSTELVNAVDGFISGPVNNTEINTVSLTATTSVTTAQAISDEVLSNQLTITAVSGQTSSMTTNTYSSIAPIMTFSQHHNVPDATNIHFLRSRGTAAGPLGLRVGDDISDLSFVGYDGSKYSVAGGITATITGPVFSLSPSASSMPTALRFFCNNGFNTVENATLTATGGWLINGLGALTGNTITCTAVMEGEFKGNIISDDSTVLLDSITGMLTGDLTGSVFSDSSTRIVDGESGRITTPSMEASEYVKFPVYADSSARDTALPSPEIGMVVFITAGTQLQVNIDGSTGGWVSLN
jgi:hypothetical protein